MAVEKKPEKRKEEAIESEMNQEQDLMVEAMEENLPVHSVEMRTMDWKWKESATKVNPRLSAAAERGIPPSNPKKQ